MSQPSKAEPSMSGIGRIGRYALLESFAEGGMARVYLALKDGAREVCVLKQLHVEFEKHATAGKRFQREAHIVSYLTHPNIARIVGAGFEGDKFCIAMEFIAGQTVEAIVERLDRQKTQLPPTMAVAIGVRVLDGLAYAHDLTDPDGEHLGIVHRDLSPRNVMVSYNGAVKVIDFGVAQGKIDNFRTAPGMMVGTLRYMAPEQALTESIDHRCDIYTVAVVLYELLGGTHLVPDGRAVEVLTKVIEERPTPLIEVNPSLPERLCAAIDRALEKRPEDRWQSAAEFRDEIRTASRSLGEAKEEHLGMLVRQLFPEERKRAEHWLELGYTSTEAETPVGDYETIPPGQSIEDLHNEGPLPVLESPKIPRSGGPLPKFPPPDAKTATDGALGITTQTDMPSVIPRNHEQDAPSEEDTKISGNFPRQDQVPRTPEVKPKPESAPRPSSGPTVTPLGPAAPAPERLDSLERRRQDKLRHEVRALNQRVRTLKRMVGLLVLLLLLALGFIYANLLTGMDVFGGGNVQVESVPLEMPDGPTAEPRGPR